MDKKYERRVKVNDGQLNEIERLLYSAITDLAEVDAHLETQEKLRDLIDTLGDIKFKLVEDVPDEYLD